MALEQKNYKPSCYEEIVMQRLAGQIPSFEYFKKELKQRGQNKKDFDAYIKHVDFCISLSNAEGFNLRNAINVVKKENKVKEQIPPFNFTKKEKDIILKAEDLGRIKAGETISYVGYDKEIKGVDTANLPKDADAFVIFSGHPGTAEAAIKTWFDDLKKTGTPKKLIFLGLHDNQGNTDFSQDVFKFNCDSEMEMYRRCFKACGVSQQIIDECVMRPTDTSTQENITLLAEIRNKYFDKNKEASFVMFGYPAYQKRIASEFAYGFQKMSDAGVVAASKFYIPDTPPQKQEKDRYLSYDNLNTIGADIIIGNCLAHPFRVSAGGRFDSKLGEYPEEFKSILPMSLVYSYPNVAKELAGTDEKVATILKLLRATQHETYEWEKARNVDNSIIYNIQYTKRDLALSGLISADLLENGNAMPKKEYIKALQEYQKDSTKNVFIEGAKTLLGKRTNSGIVKNVAEFLKKCK